MLTLVALTVLAAPWWDDYPTTMQTHDATVAAQINADSCLSGMADDPCWGILGVRVRNLSFASKMNEVKAQGRRMLTWVETFGTSEAYVARFIRGDDGKLLGFDADPTTPRTTLNHWGWQTYQPLPREELHWVGLPAYYDDEEWSRPWTRTHPRYGAAQFTYPDGKVAEGCRQGPNRPDTSHVWDAGGSKDVFGKLDLEYQANAKVTGPMPGLIPYEDKGETKYAGLVSVGKDYACPHWLEYAHASAKQLLDLGVQGLWADNYSAWDGLGSTPLRRAFGDWSVATFRDHLAKRFRSGELAELGITNVKQFDVREYLRAYCRRELKGEPSNLRDPAWRDRRWLDEPIWREYLLHKLETGRHAITQFHRAWLDEAQQAGVKDFAIQGNDIPCFSFGFPRPDRLEMVSTEFSPGWNLFCGPRGVGLPPLGRISPIIKAARTQAASRFVHVWYYLDGPYAKYRDNASLARVISYELLANHAMIQSHPGNPKVIGSSDVHREVVDFIHASQATWGDRVPAAKIGLVYSPDSQLISLAPGGIVDFNQQPHPFDLLGWGTFFSERHLQYDVVADWDLTRERLGNLAVLVLPSVLCLRDSLVGEVLRPWVQEGGLLVLSGPVGARHGEQRAFATAQGKTGRLQALTELLGPPGEGRRLGRGEVFVTAPLGFEYYQVAPAKRKLAGWSKVLQTLEPHGLLSGKLPPALEATVFRSPSSGTWFVDLANLDLDPERDAPPQRHQVTFTLGVPKQGWRGLTAAVLQPGREPVTADVKLTAGGLEVGPVRVDSYASVVLRRE